jgi:hypothetical protein
MSRGSTPERIEAAHREGTRQQLLSTGMLPERVDALIAAWEAAPESHHLQRDGRYWQAAFQWVAGQRHLRRDP